MTAAACNTIDSDRIPAYPVNINLTPQGNWDVYGVAGIGDSRCFVRDERRPSNFPWTAQTRTGYGGVLLVRGNDVFTNESDVPLAYDMACPVECRQSVRVQMTEIEGKPLPMAQCPVCKSVYDVLMGAGRPVAGPALTDNYGLRIYQCYPPANGMGGYLITNRQ